MRYMHLMCTKKEDKQQVGSILWLAKLVLTVYNVSVLLQLSECFCVYIHVYFTLHRHM